MGAAGEALPGGPGGTRSTGHGLSFLVPFRDADGTRTPAKEWILARWQHFYPDAEFIVEPDDGIDPFCKSMAVNRAAAKATGDVFCILDADTWIDTRWTDEALKAVEHGAPWVLPARRSLRLKQDVSERIMAKHPSTPIEVTSRDAEGGLGFVVGFIWFVPRDGWFQLGGMDERIRGWGGEDTMFTRAANVMLGVHRRLPGTVVSLWHARPRDRNRQRIWAGQDRSLEKDKQVLAGRYSAARNPQRMRALLSEEGGPLWHS